MYTSERQEIRYVDKRAYLGLDTIEVYEYKEPFLAGISHSEIFAYQNNIPYRRVKPIRTNIPTPRSESSVGRTKKAVRRLINANPFNIFITLTFRDNVSWDEATYELKKFNQRMKRQFSGWQFLAVPEFTKKGRLHFHLVAKIKEDSFYYSLPLNKGADIANDIMADLWGNGFAWVQKIRSKGSAGSYLAKYLNKETLDERFFNKRCFYRSRDLNQTIILENWQVDLFLTWADNNGSAIIVEREMDTIRGRILYKVLQL